MDINVILWILQIALALVFLGAGLMHATRYEQMAASPRTSWVSAVGKERVRIIGVLEILGAIGLVLPAATNILPWLTALAALLLALLMALAAIFHLRRSGEMQNAIFNIILGVLAAFLAYGRFVLDPLP